MAADLQFLLLLYVSAAHGTGYCSLRSTLAQTRQLLGSIVTASPRSKPLGSSSAQLSTAARSSPRAPPSATAAYYTTPPAATGNGFSCLYAPLVHCSPFQLCSTPPAVQGFFKLQQGCGSALHSPVARQATQVLSSTAPAIFGYISGSGSAISNVQVLPSCRLTDLLSNGSRFGNSSQSHLETNGSSRATHSSTSNVSGKAQDRSALFFSSAQQAYGSSGRATTAQNLAFSSYWLDSPRKIVKEPNSNE